MGYQKCDTFDYYTTPSTFYETVNGTATIGTQYARFTAPVGIPNRGMFINSGWCQKTLTSSQGNLIVFMSYGCNTLPGSGYQGVCWLADTGLQQIVLCVSSAGALQFGYLSGGVQTFTTTGPASAAGLIAPSTQPVHGIEFQVVIHPTAGSVQLWLDGSLVIPLTTGLVTRNTGSGTTTANQFSVGASANGMSPAIMYCDYWRVWDNTGVVMNAPLGTDRRKITKLPSANASLSQMTPVGAGTNWQAVSQNPPNAGIYVSSTTAGTTDSYVMPTAGLLSGPSMVVARSYMEKDDANTRTYQNGLISGTTTALGPVATASNSFTWIDAPFGTDPATGIAWTPTRADAVQFIHEEIS